MSRLQFNRLDLSIGLARLDELVLVTADPPPSNGSRHSTGQKVVMLRMKPNADGLTPRDAEQLRAALAPLVRRLARAVDNLELSTDHSEQALGRLVLSIHDPRLRPLAWEDELAPLLNETPTLLRPLTVVRRSSVRWRDQDRPFSLPLRVLQFRDNARLSVEAVLVDAFGKRSRAERHLAAIADEIWLSQLDGIRSDGRWAVAHVVHLSDPFALAQGALLSTWDPTQLGTLGWIARLVETLQTRLLVLECSSGAEAAAGRMVAQALADRAGPAVLVTDRADPGFFHMFYDRLIHDDPIDVSAAAAGGATVVVDDGRAESLRVSSVAVQLMNVSADLASLEHPRLLPPESPASDIVRLFNRRDVVQDSITGSRDRYAYIRNLIDREVTSRWETLEFEFHEGDGLIPTAQAVRRLRKEAKITAPAPRPAAPEAERFVNPTLLDGRSVGPAQRIPQTTSIEIGRPIQLAVQISPQDSLVRVIGARGLLEETFRWTPDMEGTWVEIGVTGIDFDVLGDPVQEVWLPKSGASDEAMFTIVPRKSPISVLRMCVYHANDVVQSLRLAANVGTSSRRPRQAAKKAKGLALARALALPGAEALGPGWAVRLEYGLAANADTFRQVERGLSIVANDLDGRSVITIKGKDVFVDLTADLGEYVTLVRDAMDPNPDDPTYRFGGQVDDELLKTTLRNMAVRGWDLYSTIIPSRFRPAVDAALDDDAQTIHVAQVVVDKVIPWAALYDRNFDKDAVDEAGKAAPFDVCIASLPGADGTPSVEKCGVSEHCLLQPARQAFREAAGEPRLSPETVVCPRHFWGFRHMIELPVQQVDDNLRVRPIPRTINVDGTSNACIAYNPEIESASQHVTDVAEIMTRDAAVSLRPPTSNRQEILKMLDGADLDIVYVYCHAYGDKLKGIFPPFLRFFEQPPADVGPAQLQGNPWLHNPLVFLNACKSGAVSPDALSAFVTALVRDREAGGMIATEISVWEPLATHAAEIFLDHFLRGRTAGQALLDTRLTLLAERNPLGLAYTLYGGADLVLSKVGPVAQDTRQLELEAHI